MRNDKLKEDVFEMYRAMVCNRGLKECHPDGMSDKERIELESIELVALMALSNQSDLDMDELEKDLKEYISGFMFNFRKKLEKHRDMKGRKRG